MRRRFVLAASMAMPFAGAFAQTGDYPNKPIKMVVPFPPGGSSDVIARIVADKLSANLKQPIVIINAPGAGGMIAWQQVASAPADGYTLFYPNGSTLAIAPQLLRKQGAEPWTQFAPVASVLSFSLVLVAHPSVQAGDLRQLVQYALANPEKLSFASPGLGTSSHLIGEMFKREAGIKMMHVPYKGGAQAVTDLLGGQVDLFFEQPLTILGHLKTGKLKALAVTSRSRLPSLPDVPTVAEAGLPGITFQTWTGIVAPIATPKEIVRLLNREINKVTDLHDVVEAIVSRGLEPMKTTPEELGKLIRDDYPRWTSLIKSQNIVAE